MKSRQANRGGNCSRQSQRKNRGRVSVPYEICKLREKKRVYSTMYKCSAKECDRGKQKEKNRYCMERSQNRDSVHSNRECTNTRQSMSNRQTNWPYCKRGRAESVTI
jgi:hypothetical protein